MAASMDGAIKKYIDDFDDSAFSLICQELISRKASFADITERLGSYLVNKDTTVRARATRLVADILNNLPTDYLSNKEGSVLTNFLCEKLQDHHSLQPHALQGLQAISCCSNLPEECVEKICRSIFKEVHCQALPQADRRAIFTIISTFIQTKLPELQKLGADFVYGYLQVMDGEKDPRNLVLAFQCARRIIEHFPLGVFTEECFEVVSCYFPIDFIPSETDPSGITQGDLIEGLRHCLAATPQFAQYCLPLLMEKLTSDLKSAKIDSLQTLAVCAEVYGSGPIQEFQSSFFNCIKKEVFLSGDPVLEEAALKALTALVKTLSTGVIEAGTKKRAEGFVQEILLEVKQHLLEPELMLMLSAGRLLQAVALASSLACSQILETCVPMLIETYNKQAEATPKYNVLWVLNGFIESISSFTYTTKCVTTMKQMLDQLIGLYMSALKEDSPLLQQQSVRGFKALFAANDLLECVTTMKHMLDQLIGLYMSALKEDSPLLQQQAVRGFKALFAVDVLLACDNMSAIGQIIIVKVLEKTLDKDVRKKCNTLFQFVARIQPQIVLQSLVHGVFPSIISDAEKAYVDESGDVEMSIIQETELFMKEMAEEMQIDTDKWSTITENGLTNEQRTHLLVENPDILDTLSAVCVKINFVKLVTRMLLQYLFCVKGCSVETCRRIFRCFISIVEESSSDIESLQYLYTNIVPAVYNWVITHRHVEGWRDRVRDEVILQHIATFLRKTVTSLTRQNQSIYPSAYSTYCVPLYLGGSLDSITVDFPPHQSVAQQTFSPLQDGEDTIYTCLLTPVLCSGPQEIDIPSGKEFIDRLSALAETVTEVSSFMFVIKCLSGLVNKWKHDEELSSLLQHITQHVESTLQSSVDKSRKRQAIQYWAWITKALVLRNHRQSTTFTDKLLELLADPSVGTEAAEGIATILTPCDDVLTKEMSANIRFMYRQRFFTENLTKLSEGFDSSTEECKKNYLLAASHLIKDLNKQVLVPELHKVFPLLIHSLLYEDVDLQLSTMLTLVDLIQNAPELVHKQMDALVPKLLILTTYKPSMKVRIAALKCIEEMSTLPLHIVIPYRSQITRALESALDDRKRLVRKQAVSARQDWFLLDFKSK